MDKLDVVQLEDVTYFGEMSYEDALKVRKILGEFIIDGLINKVSEVNSDEPAAIAVACIRSLIFSIPTDEELMWLYTWVHRNPVDIVTIFIDDIAYMADKPCTHSRVDDQKLPRSSRGVGSVTRFGCAISMPYLEEAQIDIFYAEVQQALTEVGYFKHTASQILDEHNGVMVF